MKRDTHTLSLTATPAPAAVQPVRRSKLNHRQRRSRIAWLLVAPAMLLLAAVAGWPLLRTLFTALPTPCWMRRMNTALSASPTIWT